MSEETKPYRPRCRNLHCKSMMVYGEDFESDPEYQMGVTEFICVCTATSQGPDGDGVSLDDCSNGERACFQEF